MGYTTDFSGEFAIIPTLKPEDKLFLEKLAATRRVKRNLGNAYGIDGEFYVEAGGYAGQDDDLNIVDYNSPPASQPSLWLQWVPNEEGTAMQWDGNEKFYNYIEWISYLINNIFKPRGYTLNGEVDWHGEDSTDFGTIRIKNNKAFIKEGKVAYEEEKEV